MIEFRLIIFSCLGCFLGGVAVGQYFNPWWIFPAPAHKRRKAVVKDRLSLLKEYNLRVREGEPAIPYGKRHRPEIS